MASSGSLNLIPRSQPLPSLTLDDPQHIVFRSCGHVSLSNDLHQSLIFTVASSSVIGLPRWLNLMMHSYLQVSEKIIISMLMELFFFNSYLVIFYFLVHHHHSSSFLCLLVTLASADSSCLPEQECPSSLIAISQDPSRAYWWLLQTCL